MPRIHVLQSDLLEAATTLHPRHRKQRRLAYKVCIQRKQPAHYRFYPRSIQTEMSAKAKAAAKATRRGNFKNGVVVRNRVHFYQPKTLALPRKPRYTKKSQAKANVMDKYRVIKYPLTTESAMKKIEDNNTLVFIVDLKANKRQIKAAVKRGRNQWCKSQHAYPSRRPQEAYVRLTLTTMHWMLPTALASYKCICNLRLHIQDTYFTQYVVLTTL